MSEQTIEKLKKMKLSKFAEAYQDQKGKPEYQKMSFDDRLTLLVDLEYDSRVNHTIERNIRNANFMILQHVWNKSIINLKEKLIRH